MPTTLKFKRFFEHPDTHQRKVIPWGYVENDAFISPPSISGWKILADSQASGVVRAPENWRGEFHEGDVVFVYHDEIGTNIPAEFSGIVQHLECTWQVVNHKTGQSFDLWNEITQWGYLGNIYLNPELAYPYIQPSLNSEENAE